MIVYLIKTRTINEYILKLSCCIMLIPRDMWFVLVTQYPSYRRSVTIHTKVYRVRIYSTNYNNFYLEFTLQFVML